MVILHLFDLVWVAFGVTLLKVLCFGGLCVKVTRSQGSLATADLIFWEQQPSFKERLAIYISDTMKYTI